MDVVILGGNYISLLGVARSVGITGHEVTIIRVSPKPSKLQYNRFFLEKSIEKYSRYVKKYIFIQPEKDKVLETIRSLKPATGEKAVLFPTDDFTAAVIDKHVKELSADFLFPHTNMENGAVEALMDKYRQKILAQESGLPTAAGRELKKLNNSYLIPADIQFPCIIKPKISYTGEKSIIQKFSSEKELRLALDKIAGKSDCELLIEDYVPIEKEYAVVGICFEDQIFIPFLFEMLHGGSGQHKGVTLQGRVIPLDQSGELVIKLEEFLRRISFTGLFDIDLYENNGVIYFNELNLRFGASGFAATAMGINLPELFVLAISRDPSFNCRLEESRNCLKYCRERFFVSEKVAMEEYIAGEISKREYLDLLQDADISFVRPSSEASYGDDGPYKMLLHNDQFSTCKRLIKKILKALKV